jgi:hypothetical protein
MTQIYCLYIYLVFIYNHMCTAWVSMYCFNCGSIFVWNKQAYFVTRKLYVALNLCPCDALNICLNIARLQLEICVHVICDCLKLLQGWILPRKGCGSMMTSSIISIDCSFNLTLTSSQTVSKLFSQTSSQTSGQYASRKSQRQLIRKPVFRLLSESSCI